MMDVESEQSGACFCVSVFAVSEKNTQKYRGQATRAKRYLCSIKSGWMEPLPLLDDFNTELDEEIDASEQSATRLRLAMEGGGQRSRASGETGAEGSWRGHAESKQRDGVMETEMAMKMKMKSWSDDDELIDRVGDG
jgi:hypothetical protein